MIGTHEVADSSCVRQQRFVSKICRQDLRLIVAGRPSGRIRLRFRRQRQRGEWEGGVGCCGWRGVMGRGFFGGDGEMWEAAQGGVPGLES